MALTDYTFNSPEPEAGTRNTVDRYKEKLTAEIRESLDADRSQMVTICMNLSSDFNKASIVRASNAFLGSKVWMVGKRKFDKRGTVGMHHYENIGHADTYEELFAQLIADGYTIYPVDNRPEYDPVNISTVTFPAKSAFVYGEEMLGLSDETIEACNGDMVYIRQRGAVRSMNVAQAAAVVMYAYDTAHVE